MYGSEKWICEDNPLRRCGYRLFGELHVPGRIRSNHIMKCMARLGAWERNVRMLDAGSGRGDLAIHLARRCPHWEIVGVELSPERIERARTAAQRCGLNNLRFELGSLDEIGYENEYDLIVNADVLEHIDDDMAVLRRLFRALKSDGRLILTSPSIPQRKHIRLVRWREQRIGFQPSDYGHVRDGYSKLDIEKKFRAAGGRCVESYFTYGFWGTLAFDIFFVIGDNKPHPMLFAACFPFLLAMGALDLYSRPEVGSAILAVGAKAG